MADRSAITRVLDLALFVVTCLLLVAADLSIAVSQICLGLGLSLWAAWHVAARRRPSGLGLAAPALALAVWALGMVPLSTDPGQSAVFYRRFYLFAALWVGATAAAGERRRAVLAACLLGGAVVASVWGGARMIAETGGLFSRRLGEMSNPMTSGALLMMVVLVATGVILQPRLRARVRLLAAAAAVPVLMALLATFTRGAWLGLAAGGLTILLLARPRWGAAALLAGVLLGAALLAAPERLLPGSYAARLGADDVVAGPSTTRRQEMWTGGWRMVRDRPLTGVGDRDLRAVCPLYYGDETTLYHGHLHSNPVMFAAIWGLPGLLLAMIFIGAQFVVLWQRRRGLLAAGERAPPWASAWCLGALGVWAGIFVASLFEWYFGDAETLLMNLVIIGIALGGTPDPEPNGAVHA